MDLLLYNLVLLPAETLLSHSLPRTLFSSRIFSFFLFPCRFMFFFVLLLFVHTSRFFFFHFSWVTFALVLHFCDFFSHSKNKKLGTYSFSHRDRETEMYQICFPPFFSNISIQFSYHICYKKVNKVSWCAFLVVRLFRYCYFGHADTQKKHPTECQPNEL